MKQITQILEHRFPSGVDWDIAGLSVALDDLAVRLEIALQGWDEDGLGAARGAFIRLPSGRVVLIREFAHAAKHLGWRGTDVIADAGDVVTLGVRPLIDEVVSAFGLSDGVMAWAAGEEDRRKAAEILQARRARQTREMASSTELTKILFRLDPNDWHGRPSESLWAEAVSGATAGSAYRLRNSPMFACGVSFLDIVRAATRADGEGLEFAGVIDHSGHSTYMLLVPTVCSSFEEYWNRLQDLGCTFESKSIKTACGDRILYAVDVPAETDIHAVYSTFSEGERESIWIFQEGHVGHKLRS